MFRALAGLIVSLSLAACSGGGDDPERPAEAPATPADTTPPSTPTNVGAIAVNPARIDLSWSASTDAVGVTGYRIFRNGDTSALATVTTTTYSDTSVTSSTTYTYAVRAFDAAGNVSEAGGASATTPAPPADTTPPSAPTNVGAIAADPARIDLSWNASTDAVGVTGYRIFRNGGTSALATVTSTTYSDTSVTSSTTYTYAVHAFDAAGNVSQPGGASATTPGASTVSGLDARPTNASCLAWDKPNTGGSISFSQFTSLTFALPLAMMQAPNSNTRWFVVEKAGAVRTFDTSVTPAVSATFIDITARVVSGGETGLLGMAFHPNFPTDPRVFLTYTAGTNPLVLRLAAFRTTNNGATLDPASERILLTVNKPEDTHHGGNIAFGPDGFLYLGIGDGGGQGDAHGAIGNGQRLTTLLGKMLRIDVGAATATTYAIPASNPYAQNAVCPAAGRTGGECPEIYAYGFRNPWRWSFDRANGDLWLGDVGQNTWEEVDQVQRGGNYGWRCREGTHPFNATCGPATALIDPLIEYSHTDPAGGKSVTGGYVYRGTQTTNLFGRYIFGDFETGRIWAWIPEAATAPRRATELAVTTFAIASFGQGNDGELYVVDYGGGTLQKILFQAPTGGGTVPATLSATGCVSSTDAKQPASGLIPYTVNAPFWSDGAVKERFIALPDGTQVTVQADHDWDFPNRTVLMKNFRIGTRLIETRLFMRHPDGSWGGFTYEWNAAQTDATRVQGGATRDIGGGQTWIFPSEGQCLECHTVVAGRTLGLESSQLNRTFTYPSTNRTANELYTLNHIGLFTPPIADVAAEPTLPDPTDTTVALANRARAFLHTNCSQCHRPGGPTPSTMDLRYATALNATNACNALPQSGDLGIGANARIIAPGSAANSVMINRVSRRDLNQMPPLGSNIVDTAGVALLTEWVNGLTGC